MIEEDPPDDAASPASEMFAQTYRELRQIAHARLRGSVRNTVLDTTALVHESFLRLSQSSPLQFPDRARFFVYASRVMRSVIVDMVRQRQAERHGGGVEHVTLTGDAVEAAALPRDEHDIVRVHEALLELAKLDERMAKVVEMRYFGGMTDQEVAEALHITDRTVRRDWTQARLFLAEALK